ncbi:MAG TPA: hypothetical protein VMW08_05490 [Acidimicrobiales bacterium]|nr:hypothetical protein [Acidimicrobiales bacterium]
MDTQTHGIAGQIIHGEFDDSLDAILDAVTQRRKATRNVRVAQAFAGFAVGDTVRFNDKTRPKYLVGVEGTITKKRQSKVEVTLTAGVGKFFAGSPIVVPVELIDAV